PAGIGARLATDVDFHPERVAVQARTFVAGRNMRQPMRGFEGEDFEDIHAALYRRHRRTWFPEEHRDGASLRNHAPHAVAATGGGSATTRAWCPCGSGFSRDAFVFTAGNTQAAKPKSIATEVAPTGAGT